MLAALLPLALAAQAVTGDGLPTAAAPAVALERVVGCGVAKGAASIRYDDFLQETLIGVREGASLSDAQLACVARASTETLWTVVFDAAAETRYDPIYARASEAWSRAYASAWVAAHGLAARLPHHRTGHADAAVIAATIERLCGAPSGSLHGAGEEVTVADITRATSAQLWCMLNTGTVAGLKPGFIGNEAISETASTTTP